MQFLVLAYDGHDDEAQKRRMNARERHVALGDQFVDEGRMLYGAAMLNENQHMIGSMLVVDFTNREELDAWLEIEPYVRENVWQKIEVIPCAVGPSFSGLVRPAAHVEQ